MTSDFPQLRGPRIAGWLLAAYAIGYTLLMMIAVASVGPSDPEMLLYFFAMLALAATPFLALHYLSFLKDGTLGWMDVGMTLIMACPTIFWGVVFWDALSPWYTPALQELTWGVGLMGMPAVLSAVLCLTFAQAAWRRLRSV